ncbi:Small nuclear RNA activating complex (SNAPc), subunit SNAP43 [Phytophthora cinnamomi]|uniref:Small nuclear RNA activating complex (SNAPc), subunit SNAP43 n=1 Tax=Phytophthora cinnamomi TaxID=4785 RepID=UPI0035593C89|nr:Small nuclear RNA activating complex (SNAPc), subunit SNAP43 [Phytophthora cinnamomi]
MDGAAPGPPPGLSKPPLARRPPGPHRSLKQREREAPDVDWARALQHFGGCVRADLDDLHRRFTEQRVVTFAAWKMLWRDARMSAAFHVEFWESTPTATHKTILQQALDGLVWCIEERGGEFGSETDVTALIGRVFALYCAHSVQLGTPKHKIDVDPQDWTALLTVNCVMCGAGATMFPSAAREVRAMMYRLVVLEKAFLRCLQGFGPSVRAQDRAGSRRGGGTGARQDAPSVVTNAIEDDTPVQHSKMEQLKSLNDRYQEVNRSDFNAAEEDTIQKGYCTADCSEEEFSQDCSTSFGFGSL